MVTTAPKAIKILGRGQLTIPKEVRDALNLDEDTQVSIFAIDNRVILTPKRLQRASLAKDIEKEMKKQGLSLDDLIKDLQSERKRFVKEHYGR